MTTRTTRTVIMNGSRLHEVWKHGTWVIARVFPAGSAKPGIYYNAWR